MRWRDCYAVVATRSSSPKWGRLVTSLDMAGCSLTVMWLDDELEKYWKAPADTPAYKKGAAAAAPQSGERRDAADTDAATADTAIGGTVR